MRLKTKGAFRSIAVETPIEVWPTVSPVGPLRNPSGLTKASPLMKWVGWTISPIKASNPP